MEKSSGIFFFQLWDNSGKLVAKYGNLEKFPTIFREKENENFHELRFRNIYRSSEFGSLRLIVDNKDPLWQGTKGVSRSCEVYFTLIPFLRQVENSQRQHFDSIIRRFAHNLIKFQIRFKGNFDRLISDNAKSRPYTELKAEVQHRIESNISMAADDICQIAHRAVDLDAQIDTLRIISGFADTAMKESVMKVNLQKAIFRLTNPFVDEFKKRGINFDINILPSRDGVNKVCVIPSLFNAAVWQLFDNASKYALDNSVIKIFSNLENKPPQLDISMISVCIDEDEEDQIFLEGKTGRNASSKAENGIGLFIVRKALSLMGSNIIVKNEGFYCNDEGFKYCNHRFTITFDERKEN